MEPIITGGLPEDVRKVEVRWSCEQQEEIEIIKLIKS